MTIFLLASLTISKRLPTRSPVHELDLRDYERIAPVIAGADRVFHLGAIPSVPKSILTPVPSHESNLDGTFNVYRAAAEGKAGRVIYAASSSAYGDTEVLPKTETMAPKPKSPYAGAEAGGRISRKRLFRVLWLRNRFTPLLQLSLACWPRIR